MYLIHICPICQKEYERDCTPEPDLPCDECIDDMRRNASQEEIQAEERLQTGL